MDALFSTTAHNFVISRSYLSHGLAIRKRERGRELEFILREKERNQIVL